MRSVPNRKKVYAFLAVTLRPWSSFKGEEGGAGRMGDTQRHPSLSNKALKARARKWALGTVSLLKELSLGTMTTPWRAVEQVYESQLIATNRNLILRASVVLLTDFLFKKRKSPQRSTLSNEADPNWEICKGLTWFQAVFEFSKSN